MKLMQPKSQLAMLLVAGVMLIALTQASIVYVSAKTESATAVYGVKEVGTHIVFQPPSQTTFYVGDTLSVTGQLLRNDTQAGIPGAIINTQFSMDGGVTWIPSINTMTDNNGQFSFTQTIPPQAAGLTISVRLTFGGLTTNDTAYLPTMTPSYQATILPRIASNVQWTTVTTIQAMGQKWAVWTMNNGGNGDAWAAPYSHIYSQNGMKLTWVNAAYYANGGAAQATAAYNSLGWGAVPANGGFCKYYASIPVASAWATSGGYVYDIAGAAFTALPMRSDALPA